MTWHHLPRTQNLGMQLVLNGGGGCVIELAKSSKRESRLSMCYAPRSNSCLALLSSGVEYAHAIRSLARTETDSKRFN